MPMNRRHLLSTLSAMALLTTVADAGAQTEEHTGPPTPDSVPMDKSIVFRFADMHVNHYDTGGWGRQVMHGTLPTGEFVEVHETMLPAGKMPHPPHRHRNTEFLLIRQGNLEFLNNGTPEPVGVGDVVYTASNQLHGLKNTGTTDALYFVVSISHGQM